MQALRVPQHACALLLAFALFAVQAWFFQHRLDRPGPAFLTDFNDYQVVGSMVAHGRAAQAYDWPVLRAEQIAQTGNWAFMPWAYPPPSTLITGLFGVMPIWAGYFLFMATTWLLFYAAVLRLGGRATVPAIIWIFPALLINGACGQSGFLTAGLIGWFLVFQRERSAGGGWPLGAMIFKPHLAAGIGLLALLERGWGAIARAALLAFAACAVATLVLGPAVWPAFRQGSALASAYLWSGEYPLERMITVFAGLHRLQVPPALALLVHLAFAVLGIGSLVVALRRGARDVAMAIAVGLCLMISPYTYDYDGAALGLAYALLLPAFVERAGLIEVPLAVLLSWIATSNNLWIGLRQIHYGVPMVTAEMRLWTISPLALAALAGLIALVLRRPARADAPWLRFYGWIGGKTPA